ncbi:MAG: hypothetical protein ACO1SX_12295 [Actinomycetota bacterium]
MFRGKTKRLQLLPAAVLLAVGTSAMAQSRPVPPPRALALVGVTSVGARTQAWLVDLDTRQRATLSVGESAFGYRLKRVDPERVVLTRGGQDFPLRLGEKNVPPAAPAPPPVAAALPPVVAAPPELVNPPLEAPAEPFEEPLSPEPEPLEPAEVTPQRDLRQAPEFYPGYPFGPRLSPEEAAAMGVYPGYYPGAEYPYYPGLYPPYLDASQPYPGGFDPYAGAPAGYPAWAYPDAPLGYPAWTYPDPALDPWAYRSPTLGQWDSPWVSPSNSRYRTGGAVSRWNAQTSRRQSGYFSGGAPSNPQTMRRRQSLFR